MERTQKEQVVAELAEKFAKDTYRRMIEDFLADEEGHANDLQNLLD